MLRRRGAAAPRRSRGHVVHWYDHNHASHTGHIAAVFQSGGNTYVVSIHVASPVSTKAIAKRDLRHIISSSSLLKPLRAAVGSARCASTGTTRRWPTTPGSGMFDQPPTPLIEAPELHPENPERIRNIRSALRNGPIAPHLEWHDGRHATMAELELVHDPGYIELGRGGLRRRAAASSRSRRRSCPRRGGPRSASAGHRARRHRGGARRRVPTAPTRSCGRPATTPSRRRPTATACSRTPRCAPSSRAGAASSASRSSTGTCTTATAPRRASGSARRRLTISLHMRPRLMGAAPSPDRRAGRARGRATASAAT